VVDGHRDQRIDALYDQVVLCETKPGYEHEAPHSKELCSPPQS
jgi:hypothetical protein